MCFRKILYKECDLVQIFNVIPVIEIQLESHAIFFFCSWGKHVMHYSLSIWTITGQHNQLNALAAMLASQEAGITMQNAAGSLSRF